MPIINLSKGIVVFTSGKGSCYFFSDNVTLEADDLSDPGTIEIEAGSYIVLLD